MVVQYSQTGYIDPPQYWGVRSVNVADHTQVQKVATCLLHCLSKYSLLCLLDITIRECMGVNGEALQLHTVSVYFTISHTRICHMRCV